MKKTLYFEGAGWSGADISKATLGNCRIRTAFHNDKGDAIYLEITACEVTKNSVKSIQQYKYAGFVDSCHYITEDLDDENNNSIASRNHITFEYTKESILNYVNFLGCSFEEVVILPDLAGYRVFKEKHKDGHNFGDVFEFNAERTARAEEIYKHFYALEKREGKQYPNFSLWVDQENPELLHLLRHYNGHNRHWSIQNVANWQETVTETKLGKYAC